MHERLKAIVESIEEALIVSSQVQCNTRGCDPGEMENDIYTKKVCDTCRAHWFLEEAKIAAEKYMELY